MSLVFSLSAALFATIIQQWVRYYMQLFQRYDHALKRARLRQYLFEGARRSRMSIMVEAVPALIHISLFLFFMGLSDFLFNLNTTAAIATVIPIVLCASFYIWGVISPIIRPQSAYQTPFSGLFWYLFQKIGGREHRDHDLLKPISTNMAEGRMQLAMDETDDRQVRDARAITWLINNRTEESEIEELVLSIPTSFNTSWGVMTWRTVAQIDARDEDQVLALPTYTAASMAFLTGLSRRPTNTARSVSFARTSGGLWRRAGIHLPLTESSDVLVHALNPLRSSQSIPALPLMNSGVPLVARVLIGVGAAGEGARETLPSVMGSAIPYDMHSTCVALVLCQDLGLFVFAYRDLTLERCRTVDRPLHSALQSTRSLCNALEGGTVK
ncbi:hypothetical protein BC834DRAFT_1004273 [Gloeopeniophorella convolvens]|nr:hypothetical protein BC834DRAFT_1004273 [Gloeopeniophorella convolvens]